MELISMAPGLALPFFFYEGDEDSPMLLRNEYMDWSLWVADDQVWEPVTDYSERIDLEEAYQRLKKKEDNTMTTPKIVYDYKKDCYRVTTTFHSIVLHEKPNGALTISIYDSSFAARKKAEMYFQEYVEDDKDILLSEVGFSNRVCNALWNAGMRRVSHLRKVPREGLGRIIGIGKVGLAELISFLDKETS